MFKFITHRPLWANILAAIAIALIIFFIFIFSLNWLTHHNQAKSVPFVQGRSFEEAKQTLEAAGFEVVIQDSLYIDTAKPLSVLKQIPDADELVKVNRTVYLTINRAVPPMVEMPNLVGYSYRSAEMALKNANLRVGDTSFRNDFGKNSVLEQRYKGAVIKPGDKIRMGSAISLVLGNGVGNRQFPVPLMIGLTLCEAKTLAEAQGLIIGSIIAGADVKDSCNAFVYRQRPERFDESKQTRYIRSGQMVDLWVQKEKPEPIGVPDVEEPEE